MISFRTFQSHCKYVKYGLKQDTVREFELTCRNPKCVPKGCSWGVCDEAHCPYFGIRIENGTMIDKETGKVLLTFGVGSIVFSNEK